MLLIFACSTNSYAQCNQISNWNFDTLVTPGDYPNGLNQMFKAKSWYNAGTPNSTSDYYYKDIYEVVNSGDIAAPTTGWIPGSFPNYGYTGIYMNEGTTNIPTSYKEYH